jgi:hypothetical protein
MLAIRKENTMKTLNPLKGLTDTEKKILQICSKKWFSNPAGISAIDISEKLPLSNAEVMLVYEGFVSKKLGTINKNVELYCLKFDFDNPSQSFDGVKVVTHIFFPSKEVLHHYFYKSKLSKDEIPEFKKRLHLGGCQISLQFFNEEVLKKYFDHPEKYEIDDSMAGGIVSTNGDCEEDEYLHVRYGKKLINDGYTAITAILSDLASMSPNEQQYWSSFEIKECLLDGNDENFKRFFERSFDGEWVDYPNPINDIYDLLSEFNKLFDNPIIFNTTSNIHLKPPVENTNKEFCNSCSELYKLIGPDNINSKAIKQFLIKYFGYSELNFIHKESKKSLSTLQLFKLFEEANTSNNILCGQIEVIKNYRIEADHKILDKEKSKKNYTNQFYDICKKYVSCANEVLKKCRLLTTAST